MGLPAVGISMGLSDRTSVGFLVGITGLFVTSLTGIFVPSRTIASAEIVGETVGSLEIVGMNDIVRTKDILGIEDIEG